MIGKPEDYQQLLDGFEKKLKVVKQRKILIDREQDGLVQTIIGIKKLIEISAIGRNASGPKNLFKGLSITEAAKRVLLNAGHPCSTKEIIDGLNQAGYRHKSKNLYQAIYSSFRRLDDVLMTKDSTWRLVGQADGKDVSDSK